MLTNIPWYVTNQILHENLLVPFVKDVIKARIVKWKNHTYTPLQPLLEEPNLTRPEKRLRDPISTRGLVTTVKTKANILAQDKIKQNV